MTSNFEPKRGVVRASTGIELAYEDIGEGEPLVLIMGIGTQLIHWPDGFCQHLVELGYRVIRFDNRDVGLSSKLDGIRTAPPTKLIRRALLGLPVSAPYTLVDMAADTVGLLDALGIERAHVVGASMGGMIAQTMAIHHPARVRSLTSIMSNTGERRHSIADPRATKALLTPAPRTREQAEDRALHVLRAIGGDLDKFPIDEDRIREVASLAFDRGVYPQGFVRQLAAICASEPRTAALARVRVPTAVIHGTRDPLVRPVGGRATARAIPGAKLRMIEGMGHSLPAPTWPLIGETIASM